MPDQLPTPAETFLTDDEAGAYAATYYGDAADSGTQVLLVELAKALSSTRCGEVLDFGCGPTAYVPLLAAPHADAIYMWDPSVRARTYVRRWIDGADDTLWASYAEFAAARQEPRTTPAEITTAARARTRVLDDSPLPSLAGSFDAVVANFSLEAEAKTIDEWLADNARVATLAAPRGTFFATYLVGARTWRVQKAGTLVEATNITEADVARLAAALRLDPRTITTVPLDRELYDGFAIVTGKVPSVRP